MADGKTPGSTEDFWSGFAKTLGGLAQKKITEQMMMEAEAREQDRLMERMRLENQLKKEALEHELRVTEPYQIRSREHAMELEKQLIEKRANMQAWYEQEQAKFKADLAGAYEDPTFLELKKKAIKSNDIQLQNQILAWQTARDDIIAGNKKFDSALFIGAPPIWLSKVAEMGGNWNRFEQTMSMELKKLDVDLARYREYIQKTDVGMQTAFIDDVVSSLKAERQRLVSATRLTDVEKLQGGALPSPEREKQLTELQNIENALGFAIRARASILQGGTMTAIERKVLEELGGNIEGARSGEILNRLLSTEEKEGQKEDKNTEEILKLIK